MLIRSFAEETGQRAVWQRFTSTRPKVVDSNRQEVSRLKFENPSLLTSDKDNTTISPCLTVI